MESNDTRGKNCFKIKILEITANENELNKNSKIGILSWRCGTLRTYHFPDLLHPVSCPRAVPRELSSLWGWRGYGHIWGISWHLCSSPLPPEKLGACCPSSPSSCLWEKRRSHCLLRQLDCSGMAEMDPVGVCQ